MLQQQAGLIINITDLSAFQTWPNYAHHAASKAGLVALTKVMAAELGTNTLVVDIVDMKSEVARRDAGHITEETGP